jgi:hypothetical protein
MTSLRQVVGVSILVVVAACSGRPELTRGEQLAGAGGTAFAGTGGEGGTLFGGTGGATGGTGAISGTGGGIVLDAGGCEPETCRGLGWACGYFVDQCGNVVDCAVEGLACGADEVCTGGVDAPTECKSGIKIDCPLCSAIPDCSQAAERTRLTGRVVSPGRDDADGGNQIGVPNAIVYVLRTADDAELPELDQAIPVDGTSCDRCEDLDLGPVLVGAVTDATGAFTLEDYLPVGEEFLLVVKAGRFRRATRLTLDPAAKCQTTALPVVLPDNPTRLPRHMQDGIAVNIPRIAVSTGQIDAMECVLEKMGISHDEFGNPGTAGDGAARVHLYRGGPLMGDPPGAGARIDDQTPHASELYGTLGRLLSYNIVVADCEGQAWDGDFEERDASGDNVREFVNRGGRLFASHLSFSWLHENGDAAYSEADPIATGLGPAATWVTTLNTEDDGTGVVSMGRPSASPRIENFADWMVGEGITTAPGYTFPLIEPRSQNVGLGGSSEEFVYLSDGDGRVQQFSFNTPYGAPADAACGRVAYSGFHVSVGGGTQPFADVIFPTHCEGDLTDQEKVLLYMLFDLGACVGETPPPPMCMPQTCKALGARCGKTPDGCGGLLDCGDCEPPTTK